MEIKKILWATDLSENAGKAVPLVASLSTHYQAEVHVLYVLREIGHYGAWYGDFDPADLDRLKEAEQSKAESTLDSICETELKGCPLYIRHTAVGEPASQILQLIKEEQPGLVILGTKGQGGHFDVGSVAERVVRHSPVPVVTVPG